MTKTAVILIVSRSFFLEGNRMSNIEKEEKVKRKGFGDTSTFAGFHPVAGLMYYVLVIGSTMFSMSPFFLGLSFAMGLTYSNSSE